MNTNGPSPIDVPMSQTCSNEGMKNFIVVENDGLLAPNLLVVRQLHLHIPAASDVGDLQWPGPLRHSAHRRVRRDLVCTDVSRDRPAAQHRQLRVRSGERAVSELAIETRTNDVAPGQRDVRFGLLWSMGWCDRGHVCRLDDLDIRFNFREALRAFRPVAGKLHGVSADIDRRNQTLQLRILTRLASGACDLHAICGPQAESWSRRLVPEDHRHLERSTRREPSWVVGLWTLIAANLADSDNSSNREVTELHRVKSGAPC
mmetsp:Transcript_74360/g.187335  ORF Transcript_74360/g.187335 Transcript_74360/m.187335 type:complete len:260 (+) Transcript_74360:41-820(+)